MDDAYKELQDDYHKLYADYQKTLTRACRAEAALVGVRQQLEPLWNQINPNLMVIREVITTLRRYI